MNREQTPWQAQPLSAADYQPPSQAPRRQRLPSLHFWLAIPLLLLLGLTLWFVFTLRAVQLEITPQPEQLEISGLTLNWGQRLLARPGHYNLSASRTGYALLDTMIEVPASGDATLSFELQPLPGRLHIISTPPAAVTIDGEAVGDTPISDLPLDQGGYQLRLQAEHYQPYQSELSIAGLGQAEHLTIELLPQAPVSFSSLPADAEIRIDDQPAGRTDSTLGMNSGQYQISLVKPGYRRWNGSIEVIGSQPLTVPTVQLEAAVATLRVSSQPPGAELRLDGQLQGRTPVTVQITADEATRVTLDAPGYQRFQRTITASAGAEERLRANLQPLQGEVVIEAEPADAQVIIDGQERGLANQLFKLPPTEVEIIVRKAGYIDSRQLVTPDPRQSQLLQVRLRPAAAERFQTFIQTSGQQRMRLLLPGRFVMGSRIGEAGRQDNETERQVELTRPYYIATREVSNGDYRQFLSHHNSGVFIDKTLDNDKQPVVRVSWQQAAAYCNWLSEREGLPPAYQDDNGRLRLIRPLTIGYRLPSEAEWAYAARFADSRNLTFPWGETMPPVEPLENYADLRARGLLEPILSDYDDGWAAAAPTAALMPNALGLFDMGGNVSEWTQDFYSSGRDRGLQLERDPLGPASGAAHTVRGASWRHAGITQLRLSWRDRASEGRDDLGFRFVRYAE